MAKKNIKSENRAFQIVFGVGAVLLAAVATFLLLTGGDEPEFGANSADIRTFTEPVSQEAVVAYAQLADAETLALGERVYMAECAACHGADGEGQFPSAPTEPDDTGRIGAPPHDGTGHTWHHGDDLLIAYVREGGQAPPDRFYPMPGFEEKLSDAEIEAVIAYIKTMWTEEQRLMQAERTLMARTADS